MSEGPEIMDVVAFFDDVPGERLRRGQVGTVAEEFDRGTALMEFSDRNGRA